MVTLMFHLLAVAAAGWSAPLAECDSWSIDGKVTIRQSDGDIVRLVLVQSSHRLPGTARLGRPGAQASARVEGTIVGDAVRLRITWPDGRSRRLDGGIYPDGEIDGVLVEAPGDRRLSWDSPDAARCADW